MVLVTNHQAERESDRMTKEVDARGLNCPQPVINTKKALEEIEAGTITVLVDSAASRENVRRFAQSQGCQVEITERGGAFCLTIAKGGQGQQRQKVNDVFFITSNQLGTGDKEFGEKLMIGFINNLGVAASRPHKIIFANSGVRLAVEGSEALATLQRLQQEGVEILSCGSCLEYYGLNDQLKVGIVTNSYEVVEALLSAEKVVKI
jgi:tRNA 2-thiouridine synthesizing protein A